MRHLLGIEELSREELLHYLKNAEGFVEVSERELKKVPALRGKTIINMFFEPSTRTLASFDIAGKRLSADTINVSSSSSSVKKGETLLDTAKTVQAMNPDILVMRHSESGAPHFISKYLTKTAVVNAGDGLHEHPTQALLDVLTLKQHYAELGRSIEEGGLTIAIVGDVIHSRVARSNIWAHRLLKNKIRLVGPPTLVPPTITAESTFDYPIESTHDLRAGLEGADVVMVLRMQLERQNSFFVPHLDDYTMEFCVTEPLLKDLCPDSVVMHPGPANRGIEISTEVLDGPRSLTLRQVNNGVAVRMAVLFELATGQFGSGDPGTSAPATGEAA